MSQAEESGPWTAGRGEAEPGGWLEAGTVLPGRNAQGVAQVPWLRRVLCLLGSSAVTALKL